MDLNQDPKDPKKDPEDELKKLIEELEAYKKQRQTNISYAFLLHKNYFIHLLLSLVVNFLMAATVIGLSIALDYPIVDMQFMGFVFAIILLTLLENFVKILLFKYALRLVIYSMGLLSWLVQFVIWYAITLIVGNTFIFNSVWDLMIFSVLFTMMRFIISVYIRRWMFHRTRIIIGGKK